MPNLVTHYLCGLESAKLLENDNCRELVKNNPGVFNLGTQGPDILFYYGIWPWSFKSERPKIAAEMHESKVNLVFKSFIEYILTQDDDNKAILTVYLMGFLSHNCLDSICHPYIFYRSGFKTLADNNENRYVYYHRKFETAIDVLMCERLLNKKVHEIEPAKLIQVSDLERHVISAMYEHMIKSVFKANISTAKISQAIKDMITVEKLFQDPKGIKKRILEKIDRLLFGMHLYSSMIFPLKITDGLDYLNIEKREWCMPFDRKHKSRLSFLELFEESCQRTYRLCDVLYSTIFNDNSSIPYALKLFGNRSYLSGVNCDLPIKFRYHNIIFL